MQGVPIIGGPQQMSITVSQLCVECFPGKAVPGIFIMGGDSLCGEHAGARKDLLAKAKAEEEN